MHFLFTIFFLFFSIEVSAVINTECIGGQLTPPIDTLRPLCDIASIADISHHAQQAQLFGVFDRICKACVATKAEDKKNCNAHIFNEYKRQFCHVAPAVGTGGGAPPPAAATVVTGAAASAERRSEAILAQLGVQASRAVPGDIDSGTDAAELAAGILRQDINGVRVEVALDLDQDKHQLVKVYPRRGREKSGGDKFPRDFNLTSHKTTIYPHVFAVVQQLLHYRLLTPNTTYVLLQNVGFPLIPGLNPISFDGFIYYRPDRTVIVRFHCYPNSRRGIHTLRSLL